MRYIRRFAQTFYDLWHVADVKAVFAYGSAILQTLPQIFAARSLEPADRHMRYKICHFYIGQRRRITLEIVANGATFGLARELYCERVYLTMAGFVINPGNLVIDLRANAGLFTTFAAVSGARVIAVEAQPGYLPIIQTNLVRNGCADRVVVEIGRVGATSGVFCEPTCAAQFEYWEDGSPSLSLIEIVARHQVERIDFLKVDIEGSEFALFHEAKSWLPLVKRIAMEIHPQFGDVPALIADLCEAGFTVMLRNKHQQTVESLSGTLGYLYAIHTRNL